MTKWLIDQTVELHRPASAWPAAAVTALIVPGDGAAHAWRVTVLSEGEPADLSGFTTAVGAFTRADGETVLGDGAICGNTVTVVLPAAACAVPGSLRGVLRLSDGEKVLSLSEARLYVAEGAEGAYADPEGLLPDVTALAAEYASMREAARSAQTAADAGLGAARALGPYNCMDPLALIPRADTAQNGISYTWRGGACRVEGTAASLSVHNMYLDLQALPQGLEPGARYRVKYASPSGKVWLQFRFVVDGAEETQGQFFVADGVLTVPAGAAGARVRLGVSAGDTVEETVSPRLLSALTNEELEARMDERIGGECFGGRGVLPAGTDLDGVTGEGHYVLNSGRLYPNAPYATPAAAGAQLEVLRTTGNTILQRVTVYATGDQYIRQSAGGLFAGRAWVWADPGRRLGARYAAFGDSLTAGAVWNREAGDTGYHYVREDWRIPARIGRALGAGLNYVNEGVGGMGYLTKVGVAVGEQTVMMNLVDLVRSRDFSDVEVVTVMGGANDKLRPGIPLGGPASAADDGSICGAIRAIIAHIRASNPRTQIVIIQPTPSGIAPPGDVWSARGAGGWSMDDFDAAVSALCRQAHAGYVSWYGCGLCEGWNRRNEGYSYHSGPNYTHPVEDFDYCVLGDYIAGRVAAFVQEGPRWPLPPGEDGDYRLRLTVAGGRAAYAWERLTGA